MLVCTVGDLLLDVIVRLQGRSSPGDDTPAATRVTAGGQAANVAAWAAALGAESRLIAKRGDDGASGLAADEIVARGVELVGPVVSAGGGVVVSVVDGSAERSMLTDRGPSPQLRAEEIDVGWLRDCDVCHVSGYAMLDGPIAEAAARAAGAARAQGARISVDLASARGIAELRRGTGCSRGSRSLHRTSCSPATASSKRSAASHAPGRLSSSMQLAA